METGLKSQTCCYYKVHECVLINPLPQLPGNAAQPCGFVTPPPLGLVKGTFRHSNDFSVPGSRAHLLPPDSFQMLPGHSFCSPLLIGCCFFFFCCVRTLHFVTHWALCYATTDMCHWCIFTTAFLPSAVSDTVDEAFGLTLWLFFFFRLGLQIIKSIMSNISHAYGWNCVRRNICPVIHLKARPHAAPLRRLRNYTRPDYWAFFMIRLFFA